MTEDQRSKPRRATSMALRLILPFWSMKQTVRLAKSEAARTRQNWTTIKEMSAEARQTLLGAEKSQSEEGVSQGFEEALANRKPGAMSVDQLYVFFLRRKRAALLAGALFWFFGIVGVVCGAIDESTRTVVQSLLSIAAATPLLFSLALSAQLRLWQLETRRLSAAEHGGLEDFFRENRHWLRQTLSPQYGNDKGVQP